eukprot:6368464-Prymnesium_polylepis.1
MCRISSRRRCAAPHPRRQPLEFASPLPPQAVEATRRAAGVVAPPPLPGAHLRPLVGALDGLPRDVQVKWEEAGETVHAALDGVGYPGGVKTLRYHVTYDDGESEWCKPEDISLEHSGGGRAGAPTAPPTLASFAAIAATGCWTQAAENAHKWRPRVVAPPPAPGGGAAAADGDGCAAAADGWEGAGSSEGVSGSGASVASLVAAAEAVLQ